MKSWFKIVWFSFLVLSCSPVNETIVFSVMGDIPRSDKEDIAIQKQIKLHNEISNSEFMFHVGDIKAGKTPCDENVYSKVAVYLKKLDVPTFIVPGDNEWNDCSNPDSAWHYWTKYFMEFENNWNFKTKVYRQNELEENFAFTSKGVLFIGINLVGGLVHDSTEWSERHSKNAKWIETQFTKNKNNVRAAVIIAQANPKKNHQDFMEKFLISAEEFSKPIIFIHGDGHKWIYEESWLKPNIIRIQIDKGGIAPPLKIIMDHESDAIISYDRVQFKN